MPPRKKQKTGTPDTTKRYGDWSQRALEAARAELQAKLATLNDGGAQGIGMQVGKVQEHHHSIGPSTSYALVRHDSPHAPKKGNGNAPMIISRDGGSAVIVRELKKDLKTGYRRIREAYGDNTPEDYAAMSRKQLEACAADLTGMLTALGAPPDGVRVIGGCATPEPHSATGAALEPAVAVTLDTNPFAGPAHNANVWWGVQTTIEGSEGDLGAIQAKIDSPNLPAFNMPAVDGQDRFDSLGPEDSVLSNVYASKPRDELKAEEAALKAQLAMLGVASEEDKTVKILKMQ